MAAISFSLTWKNKKRKNEILTGVATSIVITSVTPNSTIPTINYSRVRIRARV